MCAQGDRPLRQQRPVVRRVAVALGGAGRKWQDLDLVFAGPTGGIRDGRAVTRNFQARPKARGLEPIRWHALRRVFAALLQDAGVPLERVRDLMGHPELRVTESYAYTLRDSLLRDMDAIDDALSGDAGLGDPDDADQGDSGAN
jgi:integrase